MIKMCKNLLLGQPYSYLCGVFCMQKQMESHGKAKKSGKMSKFAL